MTVIAYKDGVMAADTLVSMDSGRRAYHTIKIIKTPAGALVGARGGDMNCTAFLDYFMNDDDEVKIDPAHPFEGLVVQPDGLVFITSDGNSYDEVMDPFVAIGNGAPYAMAAMDLGADAQAAVDVAIKYDIYCGGPVTVLFLVNE